MSIAGLLGLSRPVVMDRDEMLLALRADVNEMWQVILFLVFVVSVLLFMRR